MSEREYLSNEEALANLRPAEERLDHVGIAELVVDSLFRGGVVKEADLAKATKIVAEEILVLKIFGDLA